MTGILFPILNAVGLVELYVLRNSKLKLTRFVLALSSIFAAALFVRAFGNQSFSAFLFLFISLVECLGWVIVSFALDYLEGEPRKPVFLSYIFLILIFVSLLLLQDSVWILSFSWLAIGCCVNRLLLFYPQRKIGQQVALKHQINDWLGNGFLFIALLGISHHYHTNSIDHLTQLISHQEDNETFFYLLCLVMAFLLKSAMMPFHGWLIQVMEVPTPVSAFMHAGIVNLAAMLWLKFLPWWQQYPEIRFILGGWALVNVLLASTVMLTRVSIKVRLAWSTIAQIGFLLLECAFGWYLMAVLHIVGHSLYKAHAFLLSGNRVNESSFIQTPLKHKVLLLNYLIPLIAWMATLIEWWFIDTHFFHTHFSMTQMSVLSLMMAPGLWAMSMEKWVAYVIRLIWQAGYISLFLWFHHLLAFVLPDAKALPPPMLLLLIGVVFVLYLAHWKIVSGSPSALLAKFKTAVYEGFYCDVLWTQFLLLIKNKISIFVSSLIEKTVTKGSL